MEQPDGLALVRALKGAGSVDSARAAAGPGRAAPRELELGEGGREWVRAEAEAFALALSASAAGGAGGDPELADWLRAAFAGALVGFHERGLDPTAPDHHYIVERIGGDVAGALRQIREGGATVDRGEIRRELFDFGIQNVYHLDWQLYMSKELY